MSWLADEDNIDIDAPNLAQRYALAVFYFAMSGPNWTLCSKGSNCKCNPDGDIPCTLVRDYVDYLNPSHECDWFLHKCDSSNKLTQMRFAMNEKENNGKIVMTNINMKGHLPSELLHLTDLTSLQLGRNELTGTIPDFLGNMSSLNSIDIMKNHFIGTIPDSIFKMDQLLQLKAMYNKLTGTLSPKFGDLTNLRVLHLNGNKLEGTVPLEMGNLTKLTSLQLSNNDLNGTMPESVCLLRDNYKLATLSIDCEELDCDCCTLCE